jgi:hypothetical protein
MGEAVMVLPPDRRGNEQIQGGNWPAPRQLAADLQPFAMLVEHRIDYVNKRLVAGKKAMPPAEKIRFQPALQGVLA